VQSAGTGMNEAHLEVLPERDFDPTVPNVARIYDWLLGGKDNFAADRRAGQQLVKAVPAVATAARGNRAFLGRAVRYLDQAGICQFIDIGAGLPTARAVHEIVCGAVLPPRVVYGDNDPVVLSHAQALAGTEPGVEVIRADIRHPDDVLSYLAWRQLIDLGQPVAILLVAVLHFVRDNEDPWELVNILKDRIAPGSYLVISHGTADHISPEAARNARDAYEDASAPGVARSLDQVARFFAGLEMVPPGLVPVSEWRPDCLGKPPEPVLFYAGIGCKTAPGRPR
jgi:hypothetical protein